MAQQMGEHRQRVPERVATHDPPLLVEPERVDGRPAQLASAEPGVERDGDQQHAVLLAPAIDVDGQVRRHLEQARERLGTGFASVQRAEHRLVELDVVRPQRVVAVKVARRPRGLEVLDELGVHDDRPQEAALAARRWWRSSESASRGAVASRRRRARSAVLGRTSRYAYIWWRITRPSRNVQISVPNWRSPPSKPPVHVRTTV